MHCDFYIVFTAASVVTNKPSSEVMSVDLSAQHPACRSPSVLCESTALCMSPVQLCDGKLDCPDGSDELSCIHSCLKMGNVHVCLKLVSFVLEADNVCE